MAIDRQGSGLAILRIGLGIFFLFEGLGKVRWFTTPSLLAAQLAGWAQAVPAASWSHVYLDRMAMPYVLVLARLVPLGELTCGVAMIVGLWTPLVAFVAFFMALNFQFASGALFKYSVLTSGYALPVLGSTLALTV
ncbi:MAG: DoxX family membrane protein, partial [Vicinamibacterales bacterium]